MFLAIYYITVICAVLYTHEIVVKSPKPKQLPVILSGLIFTIVDILFINAILTTQNVQAVLFVVGSKCFIYSMLYCDLNMDMAKKIIIDISFITFSIIEIFAHYQNTQFVFNLIVFMIFMILTKVFRFYYSGKQADLLINAFGIGLAYVAYLINYGFNQLSIIGLCYSLSVALILGFYFRYKSSVQILASINETHLLKEDSESAQYRLNLLMDIYGDAALFEYTQDKDTIWVNANFCALFGLQKKYCFAADALIKEFESNILLESEETHTLFQPGKGVVRIITKNFEPKWIKYQTQNQNGKIIGAIIDITNEKERELNFENALKIDDLTGLMSRYEYKNTLKAMVDNLAADQILAFYLLDINRFKIINDRYGHGLGDEILKEFANRLLQLGPDKVYIRIAGDEFGIIEVSNESIEATIRQTWIELNELCKLPVLVEGLSFDISCACGVAIIPTHASLPDKIIEYADFALNKAKNNIKEKLYIFNPNEYEEMKQNIEKSKAFDKILETQDFYHVFQPIVSTRTGEVEGYEALMRVNNGTLFPNIGSLFETAIMHKRLRDVEEASIKKLFKDMTGRHIPDKKLFVNFGTDLSVDNKALSNNPDINVVYEITEYAQLDHLNLEYFKKTVKRSGGSIAVDDFGAGYSNELSLLTVQPDFIKIDMGLIRNIDTDPRKQTLVRNIIQYAHMLNIRTVAEGVETLDEMKCLIGLDTDYLQGFYLGRPAAQFHDIPSEIKHEILNLQNK